MKRYIDYLIRSEEHRVDEMLFLQIKERFMLWTDARRCD